MTSDLTVSISESGDIIPNSIKSSFNLLMSTLSNNLFKVKNLILLGEMPYLSSNLFMDSSSKFLIISLISLVLNISSLSNLFWILDAISSVKLKKSCFFS